MLQPGDTLEYQTATRVTHPAAPGQFWTQHAFVKDAIALDERLEISVPLGRRVAVRSPGFLYATDETSRQGTHDLSLEACEYGDPAGERRGRIAVPSEKNPTTGPPTHELRELERSVSLVRYARAQLDGHDA